MADIIQRITVSEPDVEKTPLQHMFDREPKAHAKDGIADERVSIDYICVDDVGIRAIVADMMALATRNEIVNAPLGSLTEAQILAANATAARFDYPVSLSVSEANENPKRYTVTYAYPHDADWYVAQNGTDFGEREAPLTYTPDSVESRQVSFQMSIRRFGRNGVVVAIECDAASFSVSITAIDTGFDWSTFDITPLLYGAKPNPNTLRLSKQKVEDTTHEDKYSYTWTGTILVESP